MTAWPFTIVGTGSAWLDRLLAPGPARTTALAMIGVTLIAAGVVVIVSSVVIGGRRGRRRGGGPAAG